jgi:hypothetical protein
MPIRIARHPSKQQQRQSNLLLLHCLQVRKYHNLVRWLLVVILCMVYASIWISTSVKVSTLSPRTYDELRDSFFAAQGGGGSSSSSIKKKHKSNDKDEDNNSNQTSYVHGFNDQAQESSYNRRFFVDYQLYHNDDDDNSNNNRADRQTNSKRYNMTFGYQTTCKVGVTRNKWGRKPVERVPLPPQLQDILGVTTFFKTNLRIITVGDSVGMQFHELLEEAAGVTWSSRRVYRNAWGDHESVSVSELPLDPSKDQNNVESDTPGILSAFRMTGMLLKAGKYNAPPNAEPVNGAGGWHPDHVQCLLNHTYHHNQQQQHSMNTDNKRIPMAVSRYDVMIFRIPHGWLTLNFITKESITESLLLAHELFGIQTAIVQTLFQNNNVKTNDDLDQLRRTNEMIRELVHNWNHPKLPTVLLMDFGRWTDDLIQLNAELAGMDVSAPTSSSNNSNYTLARLSGSKFPPSIAMACSKAVAEGSKSCQRNMLTIDGMHWCMESIGGRVVAAIACLLQCSLLQVEPKAAAPSASTSSSEISPRPKQLSACEDRCNQQFMSMTKAEALETM